MKQKTVQTVLIAVGASVAYVVLWQAALLLTGLFGWYSLRALLALYGTIGLFVVGLGWVVWVVELIGQQFERLRHQRREYDGAVPVLHKPLRRDADQQQWIWNPLDPGAWFYGGRRHKRLFQSIFALSWYSLAFFMALFLLTQIQGCKEYYDSPAGGGKPKQVVQKLKVKKIIRKKFLVNPFSPFLFDAPDIEKMVKFNFRDMTKHSYQVGQGEGEGAGFAGGRKGGKVRFIRLEYSGGDWDQNFGIGGDNNLLDRYAKFTGHKVAEKTESRTVAQLKRFPIGRSPALVYMTGQKSISLSKSEIKILREYLNEKHGMIFCSNGGSPHFHNQFDSMMNNVVPNAVRRPIQLDDPIHRGLDFIPIVAPHGGKQALGWYLDGRLICYYHPGDIGDAWCDDHAGVKSEIFEASYQLGINVIFHAHAEYSKWNLARKKRKK